MSGPCACWAEPVRLHDGHCCMLGSQDCHPEVLTAIRDGVAPAVACGIVAAPACGCLSWLDRMDKLTCAHDVTR